MRCLVILSILLLQTTFTFAQNYPSESYLFSKTRDHGYRIKHLKSPQHQMKVMSNVKKGFDYLERRFVYDGQPYRWELHDRKPSLLYCGDSVIAEVTDDLRVNNVKYGLLKKTNRSFEFIRNGKEVMRGYFTKEKEGTVVTIDILEDQGAHQHYMSVIAAFMGLRIIENKRSNTAAGWIFFLGGVGVTMALDQLDDDTKKNPEQ